MEEVAQENFLDALQIKFVQMEEDRWGCQMPYSDKAGSEVVCGLGCEEQEIGIILYGKTMRNYSGGIKEDKT